MQTYLQEVVAWPQLWKHRKIWSHLNDMLIVVVNGKNIILLAFKDFFVCVVMIIGTHYWRWDIWKHKNKQQLTWPLFLCKVVISLQRKDCAAFIQWKQFSSCFTCNTSNSWHHSHPRSEYCRSIVFLLVLLRFEIYRFRMKIFIHIPYNR